MSLRLISADGTLVAQRDVPVEEEVTVQLYVPPDALPGPYDLVLLVYDGETMDPIRTVEGVDLVTLASLAVGRRRSRRLPAARSLVQVRDLIP